MNKIKYLQQANTCLSATKREGERLRWERRKNEENAKKRNKYNAPKIPLMVEAINEEY